jgi:hypothetical protein
MRRGVPRLPVVCAALWLGACGSGAGLGAEGFRTITFGNSRQCEVQGALWADADSVRFDLAALPSGTKVYRAVLRVSAEGHANGTAVRLVPAGLPGAGPLPTRPPRHDRFDATPCVRSWVARPETNKGSK